MKIVRHVARDMRQAMRAIRERLGEDAVILSSRRTSDGVEVTAAIDFDAESLDSAPIQPLVDTPESPLLRREAHPARSESAFNREAPYTVPGPEGAHVRETTHARREAALTRRETPPIRDEDEPVHSKVPARFDERPTQEPALAAQRLEADSPLISRELQAALLDSLVVRDEEPSRAAAPAAARATPATDTALSSRATPAPRQESPARETPATRPESPARETPATRREAPSRETFATHLAHAAQESRTSATHAAHESLAPVTHMADAAPESGQAAPHATPAGTAHATLAPASTAVARLEAQAAYATQPLDFDLTEPTETPRVPQAAHHAAGTDVVGTELKNLRRMLETQLAQLAWNDMTRRAPVHTEMLRELSEIGIAQDLSSQITQQLSQDVDLTYARRFSIAALSQYLLVTGDRWLDSGGRIAFIGSTGVGKTMTLSKLAVRWVLRHGARDLALVAADNIRLGAQDQMRALGQLLGAPVYTPENFETLPTLLSKLQQRFILIDTPGSSLRDTQLSGRLAVLASSASQLQTALVLAASTQAGALEEVVKRFAPANPCCCVLTKVDEAASLGGALSVLIRARVPVSYVSEGQRVPEDLRPARALELVSHAVRLAKATGAAADEDLLRRRFGKIAHALT
jgi:flagellar biosynthesis protein FlhF